MLELEQARLKTVYLEHVSALSKLDLLVIDDFGLMELDLDNAGIFSRLSMVGTDGNQRLLFLSSQ